MKEQTNVKKSRVERKSRTACITLRIKPVGSVKPNTPDETSCDPLDKDDIIDNCLYQ